MKLTNGYQTTITTSLFIVLISIFFSMMIITGTEAAPMPLGFQKVDCIVSAGSRSPYCGGGRP